MSRISTCDKHVGFGWGCTELLAVEYAHMPCPICRAEKAEAALKEIADEGGGAMPICFVLRWVSGPGWVIVFWSDDRAACEQEIERHQMDGHRVVLAMEVSASGRVEEA